MRNFAIKVGINAVALWVAALVVPGIELARSGAGWQASVITVVFVALVFGLVNAVIKPLVKLLAFPALVLTLGLFTFVINALMLQITEWLAGPLHLAFHIDSFFWTAIMAAVVVTLVSWALSLVLPDGD